jgi:hypothetical protein
MPALDMDITESYSRLNVLKEWDGVARGRACGRGEHAMRCCPRQALRHGVQGLELSESMQRKFTDSHLCRC